MFNKILNVENLDNILESICVKFSLLIALLFILIFIMVLSKPIDNNMILLIKELVSVIPLKTLITFYFIYIIVCKIINFKGDV